jgi:hypothetical protein
VSDERTRKAAYRLVAKLLDGHYGASGVDKWAPETDVLVEVRRIRDAMAAAGAVELSPVDAGDARLLSAVKEAVVTAGLFAMQPCPACLHTRCGPECSCDCAGSSTKEELA